MGLGAGLGEIPAASAGMTEFFGEWGSWRIPSVAARRLPLAEGGGGFGD